MTQKELRKHVFFALALAFFFRSITAFFVYGPQSVDDYSHGLLPAWEALRGIAFDLPLWRSPVLVWTLIPFAWLGQKMGLTVSFDIFRVILFFIGAFSLWMIWAYAKYAERSLTGGLPSNQSLGAVSDRSGVARPADEQLQRRLVLFPLYLLSLHFILSFAMTRAFGEVIATTLVFVALLWMNEAIDDRKQALRFVAGALLLGLACLYRYQIGVLGVGMAGYLAYTRRWREFGWLALGGVLAGVVEAGKDVAYGRFPFETLYNYFYVNKDGAVEHSIQPWYNTWVTVLIMFFIPLSLPLFAKAKKTIRIERIFIGLILFFTLLHSLIPHKEERFLYPILPLVLFLLGRIWAKAYGTGYEKWVFRPVILALMVFGLGVASLSNSQSGEYEPILRADRHGSAIKIWDWESLLDKSFFRHRLIVAPVEYETHAAWPTVEELEVLKTSGQDLMLVTSNEERLEGLRAWVAAAPPQLHCGSLDKIQSLGDRMIYARNPKYNVRRKPTWMTICNW